MAVRYRWRTAYIIKELKDRDFSEIRRMSEEIVFLYGEDARVSLDLPELIRTVGNALSRYNPDTDVLILAGPSTACAIAFAHLLEKCGTVNVATYADGQYSFFKTSTWGDTKNNEYISARDLSRVGGIK